MADKDKIDEFLDDMAGFVKGAVAALAEPPKAGDPAPAVPPVPAPAPKAGDPAPVPTAPRVSRWFGELS